MGVFPVKEVWEWVRSIAIAIILALLIRFFIVEVFLVRGQSMYPTLENGERLIVNKFIYEFYEPDHEDIIVFQYTEEEDYIKRVIGVGEDEVKIKNNTVKRNGKPIEEDYLPENDMEDYGPVTVPSEHLFVLGDNRNSSKDSRHDAVGFVSLEEVKGKAFFVFWPLDNLRLL